MAILKRFWLAFVSIGATALFFHRAVFTDQIFISRDIQRVYYPFRRYWTERVLAGEFPDWYPYDALGQPYVGMVISGAFHPTNLLGLFLSPGMAIKVNVLLCYPFAIAGTYLFARRLELPRAPALLSGMLYAFSGYMVAITNNLLYLMAAATFPWAFWAADRFFSSPSILSATIAALCASLVLYAGDSQSFVVCCTLLVALAFWRSTGPAPIRRAGLALGLMLLTAAVSAAQLLPALSVLRGSKAGEQTLKIAQTWSFHPLRILDLLIGPLFKLPLVGPDAKAICRRLLEADMDTLWVDSVYLGAPAFALGGLALWTFRKNVRAQLIAVGLLALVVLSLGKYAGLYEWLYRLVPLWRPFRYPEKLLPYALFTAALAAGAGLKVALESVSARRRAAWVLSAVAAGCFGLAAIEYFAAPVERFVLPAVWSGMPPPAAVKGIGSAFVRFSVATGLTAAVGALILGAIRRSELAGTLMVLTFAGSQYAINEPVYELTFPVVLETPSAFVERIREAEGAPALGGYRVGSAVESYSLPKVEGTSTVDRMALVAAYALEPDIPAFWGLESFNGYLPAASSRYADLTKQGRVFWTRHLGLMSGRYVSLNADTFAEIGGAADVVVSENVLLNMVLLRNPLALPRAYFTHERCAGDSRSLLRLMRSRGFETTREALIECPEVSPPVPAGDPPGTVEIASYAPEEVRVRVQARQTGLLVLTDAYYPGWTATVDGEPAEILPTNHALRGVRVEAGSREVVFRYRTPGLAVGVLFSLLTLAAGLALGLLRCRRASPG